MQYSQFSYIVLCCIKARYEKKKFLQSMTVFAYVLTAHKKATEEQDTYPEQNFGNLEEIL